MKPAHEITGNSISVADVAALSECPSRGSVCQIAPSRLYVPQEFFDGWADDCTLEIAAGVVLVKVDTEVNETLSA